LIETLFSVKTELKFTPSITTSESLAADPGLNAWMDGGCKYGFFSLSQLIMNIKVNGNNTFNAIAFLLLICLTII
jgi:hypothetical protein